MQRKAGESVIYKVWRFYLDGFKDLSTWSRNVWIILLIKLFIFFVIIRLLFMPDFLKKNYKTEKQRSQHVLENLTTPNSKL